MNKKSLEKQLKNLRYYLKQIDNVDKPSFDESKIFSHTLAGMIMSINNLVNSGAYHIKNNDYDELFSIISEARNTSIHYGYFDDYGDIYSKAKNISKNTPQTMQSGFGSQLKLVPPYDENEQFVIITSNDATKIYSISIPEELFVFKNIRTNQEVYVHRENLVIVENKYDNHLSFVLKDDNEKCLFFKDSPESQTVQMSYKDLQQSFFSYFNVQKTKKLNRVLNKLLDQLSDNKYANLLINTKYGDQPFCFNIHNVLRNFLYNKTIDEKILLDRFNITENTVNGIVNAIETNKINQYDLATNATLLDIFYMELFLKRYRMYQDLLISAKEKNLEINQYAKQSMLTSIFQFGATSFSDKLLKSDRSNTLPSLYYYYRNSRNKLAHWPITDEEEKIILTNELEYYTDEFYEVISKVYNAYCKSKAKDPYFNFKESKKYDAISNVIYNKTNKYCVLKHSGICKIIDGKKYLKLDIDENRNIYMEIDRSLLVLDYNNFTSKECIIPLDSIKLVNIDENTNMISRTNYHLKKEALVDVDTFMTTLLQARDYLKSHPQYDKKNVGPYFCAITVYDDSGNPIYTEGIKNILFRRFQQKVIPDRLLEASSLIIPKNMDEPLIILDKNKNVIARAYLACINTKRGKKTISQLLTNKEQKEIEYGKLLEKDLKTNELTITTKEVRMK